VSLRYRAVLLAGLLGATSALPASSQQADTPPDTAPRITLVTFGPGTANVWERFGHNMIRVTDPVTGFDAAYNFGVYNFAQKHFFWNFVQGRMEYAADAWNPILALRGYADAGRSIEAQDLALTPEQAEALAAKLARNVLPENKDYRYDYYRDNCSTRVRDALNTVLGGEIERALSQVPTGATYRSRTAELTAASPGWYFTLMLLLGPATDRPLTAWEDSFIPMNFALYVEPIVNPALDGGTMPLVAASSSVPASDAVAQATGVPSGLLGWFLVLGVLLGGGLLWAGARTGAGRGRGPFLVIGALWSFLSGLFGFAMLYLWAFTDHVVAYRNENILQASVLGLVMFGFFAGWARRGGEVPAGIAAIARAVAILSLAGVALQLLPWFSQVNAPALVFFVPANLGMALGARRAVTTGATTPAPTAALP